MLKCVIQVLLNRPSSVNDELIWQLHERLGIKGANHTPTLSEIVDSIKALKSRKSPGEDGLPPDVFKHGAHELVHTLHKLFEKLWESSKVPQQFKDPKIITIIKNKGSRAKCGNYRGIWLLAVSRKVIVKVIQRPIVENLLGSVSELQREFRAAKRRIDMMFTA